MIILNAMQSLIRNVTPTYILPSKCNRSCRMTYPSKHTQPIILPSYNPLYEKRIKPLYKRELNHCMKGELNIDAMIAAVIAVVIHYV